MATATPTPDSTGSVYKTMNPDVTALLTEGDGLAREKKWNEALERYRAAVAFEPANARIHFLIGSCHFKMNEGSQAREAFFRAISLDPSDVKICTWIHRITGLCPKAQVLEAW